MYILVLLLSKSLENILATLSIPVHELLCAQPTALFFLVEGTFLVVCPTAPFRVSCGSVQPSTPPVFEIHMSTEEG